MFSIVRAMDSRAALANQENAGEGSFLSPRFWLPVVFVGLAIASLWWLSGKPAVEVAGDSEDDRVLLVLDARSGSETRRERELKATIEQFPRHVEAVAALARLYIERARSESDPRYLGYAQHLLEPWRRNPAPHPAIRRLRAILLQSQHRFEQALVDLDALLEAHPHDPQARLTRATVHQVLGNYRDALRDCLSMPRHAAIPALVCTASILSLTGAASEAQALLAGIAPRLPAEPVATRQWILTLRGDIARRGNRLDQAETYYRRALSEPLRSAYLLREYSQLLLDLGRFEAVLDLLSGETRDDSLLLHAAIAAKRSGAQTRADEYARLIEMRLRVARLRGSSDHYYLQARYAFEIENEAEKALPLARSNWRGSKETRDTRLYAAVAAAVGDRRAIAEIERWMSREHAILTGLDTLTATAGDMAR